MTDRTIPRNVGELARFGGSAMFTRPRPVGQLYTPPLDKYLALLRAAWEDSGANGGDAALRLERELAAFHGVRHCLVVVNACAALILLMRHFADGRAGEVVMPAFSYRGLPHLAQWAGQMPRFCDVDERSHVLDPVRVAEASNENVTSILAVTNFNSPGDIDGLWRVANEKGVPLILDSVDAVGTWYGSRRLGGFGNAETFSLHATKLLNGFEGGYITTDDDDLAASLRDLRKRGPDIRLNDFHAAMGSLSLGAFDTIVARNRERFETYERVCAQLPGLSFVPYADPIDARRNYRAAVLKLDIEWPLSRDDTAELLRAEGVLAAPYYSPPLHRSVHAPLGRAIPSLPVTDKLAESYLELPTGDLISLDDIENIGRLLEFLAVNADVIRKQLHSGTG